MMHRNRRWMVSIVESPEKLAEMLTQCSWTLCAGFTVAGHEEYLFLNDATCEDGAQEFAAIKGGLSAESRSQVESITFSWCDEATALGYIKLVLCGKCDFQAEKWHEAYLSEPLRIAVEPASVHGRCRFCE